MSDEVKEKVRKAFVQFRQTYPINVMITPTINARINLALRLASLHLIYNDMATVRLTAALPRAPINTKALTKEVNIGLVLRDSVLLTGASPCFCTVVDAFVSSINCTQLNNVELKKILQSSEQLANDSLEFVIPDMFGGLKRTFLTMQRNIADLVHETAINASDLVIPDGEGRFSYVVQENCGIVSLSDAIERFKRPSVKCDTMPDKNEMMIKYADCADVEFDSNVILSILLQVIHALCTARDACGFVHCDLTSSKVMLKRVCNPIVARSTWAFKLPEKTKMVDDQGAFVKRAAHPSDRYPFVVVDVNNGLPDEGWLLIPPEMHKGLLAKITQFDRSRVDMWWKGPDDPSRYISYVAPSKANYAQDPRLLAASIAAAESLHLGETGSDKLLADLLLDMINTKQVALTMQKVSDALTRDDDNAWFSKHNMIETGYVIGDDQRKIATFVNDLLLDPSIIFREKFIKKYGNDYDLLYYNLQWHMRTPLATHAEDCRLWSNAITYCNSRGKNTRNVTIMALDLSNCEDSVRQAMLGSKPHVLSAMTLFEPSQSVIWQVNCRVCRTSLVSQHMPFCSNFCHDIYAGKHKIYATLNVLYDHMFYGIHGEHIRLHPENVSRVSGDCSTCTVHTCHACPNKKKKLPVASTLVEIGGECSAAIGKCVDDADDIRILADPVFVCSLCAKPTSDTSNRCQMCNLLVCCTENELASAIPSHELICPGRWFPGLAALLTRIQQC